MPHSLQALFDEDGASEEEAEVFKLVKSKPNLSREYFTDLGQVLRQDAESCALQADGENASAEVPSRQLEGEGEGELAVESGSQVLPSFLISLLSPG